jgi:hypothetical protein
MTDNLQALVERLARRYFPQLGRVPSVVIGRPADCHDGPLGWADGDTIWLAPRTLLGGRLLVGDTIVHELVHTWEAQTYGDIADPHGAQFVEQALRISPAILRLPYPFEAFDAGMVTEMWPVDMREAFESIDAINVACDARGIQ